MTWDYLIPIISYVIVANPATYKLTAGILGKWIADANGTAQIGGLILHAIVFLFLTSFLLALFRPKKDGFQPTNPVALMTGGVSLH
jgi:hypothetical protein